MGKINQIKVPETSSRNTALLYLPDDYDKSKPYPCILFFHGKGEAGNDITKVLNQGLPAVLKNLNGDLQAADGTKFIMLAMQGGFSVDAKVMFDGLNYTRDHYDVNFDPKRIYITGLSAGGQAVLSAMPAYHDQIAATVCMSPAAGINSFGGSKYYSDRYIWFFQGEFDHTVSPNNAIDSNTVINKDYPGHSKITMYGNGHCCWNQFYDPTWKENGLSIYDWFLQYTSDGVAKPPVEPPVNPSPPPPEPPKQYTQPRAIIKDGHVEKGQIIITLPENKITLDGTPTTGSVDHWQWGKLSGPGCDMGENGGSTLDVSNLKEGHYTFYLSVKSDHVGWTSSDIVDVIVKAYSTPKTIKNIDIYFSDDSEITYTDVKNVLLTMNDGTQKLITTKN